MIFSLSFGDSGVLTTDRLEQVDAVSTSNLILSGVVPGSRELSTTFRYKNPTTWSVSAALSDSALAAIVVDSDQDLYFEFTYTRTGADTTGTIDILRHDLTFTIDPSATLGPGRFTNLTIYSDVVDFVGGYIGDQLEQVLGADGFTVEFAKPNKCRIDLRPKVYYHRVQLHEQSTETLAGFYRQRVSFRVGVKGQCDRDEVIMRQQISYILALFDPYQFATTIFDIVFKGEERNAIKAYQLGVIDPSRTSMIELEDPDCDCIMNEIEVQFYLEYPIEQNI